MTSFTLAEVLIVLGIIGLIADMTIPTLVSSTKEKVAVARLQKTYSTFENAFRLAVAENGTPDNWGLADLNEEGSDPEANVAMANKFIPYLKILKNCGESNCGEANYKTLDGRSYGLSYKGANIIMLADGTIIFFVSWSADCEHNLPPTKNVCGSLTVDINGPQPPNQLGVDTFAFYLTKFNVKPWGLSGATNNVFETQCQKNKNSFENGDSCTAWVLYNGNMDYLHCSDLSWNGKKKCS